MKFILTIVMGALLLGWLIFCAVKFILSSRNIVAGAGFTGHVKCEKCGTVYDVSSRDFTESYMIKSRSVTKTKIRGAAFVNKPEYKYFAKKFYCPHCQKKRYAQVLNINEKNDFMEVTSYKSGIIWLAAMAVGGIIIMLIMSIPMHFADKAAENKAEVMKQQHYEEFKDRYDLD